MNVLLGSEGSKLQPNWSSAEDGKGVFLECCGVKVYSLTVYIVLGQNRARHLLARNVAWRRRDDCCNKTSIRAAFGANSIFKNYARRRIYSCAHKNPA